MKIGIGDGPYVGRYGMEKGLYKMAEHGYQTIDWNCFVNIHSPLFEKSPSEWKKELLAMKAAAENAGIEIIQTHGPWNSTNDYATPEARKIQFDAMVKSLEGCAVLGCPNMVIHYIMPYGAVDLDLDEARKINFEYFSCLAEKAGEIGVTACLENMPFYGQGLARPKEIVNFVKEVNHPKFRVCLDTGHCIMFGVRPGDAVRQIGKDYLYTLHVHDNDGRQDHHDLPGSGKIDWEDFRSSLAEIGYEGSVSLECGVRNLPAGSAARDAVERSLVSVVKHLASQD